MVGRALVGLTAVLVAREVHAQLPWVPPWYLVALLVLPFVAWRLVRWRHGPPLLRWPSLAVVVAIVIGLCPLPWMTADLDEPPGTAWRLDGRLTIDGERIDPPGAWYWLTVGRPPTVAEVVISWVADDHRPRNLATGAATSRPVFNEPAAAAVGLRRAGLDIEVQLVVEVSGARAGGLPSTALLASLNGIALTSTPSWARALDTLREGNSFTTTDGRTYAFTGPELPYEVVDVFEQPAQSLDVKVGGRWADTAPGRWFRGLAVGKSHGLMVALVAYAHASGRDLARGRSIAGTGGISGDGSVERIGGLRAKAAAARDVGADVLLYPAEQSRVLDGFAAGSMRLLPVASLEDAITALLM